MDQTDFEYEDLLGGDAVGDAQISEMLKGFVPSPQAPKAPFSADADPSQLQFIHSDAHTIRLLAPAGSGKTQSIANRVARRISSGTPANRILLLTFDNAARVTLVDRIHALLRSYGYTAFPPVV